MGMGFQNPQKLPHDVHGVQRKAAAVPGGQLFFEPKADLRAERARVDLARARLTHSSMAHANEPVALVPDEPGCNLGRIGHDACAPLDRPAA